MLIWIILGVVLSIFWFALGILCYCKYRSQQMSIDGLPATTTPPSVYKAESRKMTRYKLAAEACAFLWPFMIILGLNSVGPKTLALLGQEFGYGLACPVVVGITILIIRQLTRHSFREEFTIARFIWLSAFGAISVWILVAVFEMRSNPSLWEEVKRAFAHFVTNPGG